MSWPHTTLSLEDTLAKATESHGRAFLAYLASEPPLAIEAKEEQGKGPERAVEEYDGFDDFTWTTFDPDGKEKHYRIRAKQPKQKPIEEDGHWVAKTDKDLGRPLIDPNDRNKFLKWSKGEDEEEIEESYDVNQLRNQLIEPKRPTTQKTPTYTIIKLVTGVIMQGDSKVKKSIASNMISIWDVIEAIKDNRCLPAENEDLGSTYLEQIVGGAIRDVIAPNQIAHARSVFGLEPLEAKKPIDSNQGSTSPA